MSFASLADMVKHYESGGNYTAQNPNSSASGAYQFTNATWQSYAGQIGYSQYSTAASAPPAVQDAVFQQAVSQRGLGDWTCPGCNANLTSYLSANPDQASLPITSTGNASLAGNTDTSGQGYGSNGISGPQSLSGGYIAPDGSYVPPQAIPGVTPDSNAPAYVSSTTGQGYGQPYALGLQSGLISGINTWITGIETAVGTAFKNAASAVLGEVGNLFLRGGIIILALLLLLIALWRIIDPSGEKTKAVIRNAAEAA